jgi:hypothetical protein
MIRPQAVGAGVLPAKVFFLLAEVNLSAFKCLSNLLFHFILKGSAEKKFNKRLVNSSMQGPDLRERHDQGILKILKFFLHHRH